MLLFGPGAAIHHRRMSQVRYFCFATVAISLLYAQMGVTKESLWEAFTFSGRDPE